MKNKRFIILLGLIFSSAAFAAGITSSKGMMDFNEDPANFSKIIVDTSKTGQTIDKQFYGSHIDSYSQLPDKKLVDELQLGRMRVGGNEFDVFNWKINKGVNSKGQVIDVPGMESLVRAMELYNVGGIYQLNLTGYMPEKVNNNYVIRRSFTAESAYEMIKHLNGTLKLKIVDLSMGNEFSIWNETHPKIWPTTDGISADEYIDRYVQFAIAVRKAQEEVTGNPNSIKLWGPEISTSWYEWNTSNFDKDCEWTDIRGEVACHYGNGQFSHFLPYFMNRLKLAENDILINPRKYKLMDYLAIHYYPNFRTKIDNPDSIITNSEGKQLVAEMLEATRVLNDPTYINKIDISSFKNFSPNILGRMNNWIKENYPDAKLVINEFAVDSDYRTNKYHPIVRPLYLADAIGIFVKEGVAFLNQFLLSSDEAAKLPWSMIENGKRKELFYMYKLFTNHFKGTVVETNDNLGDAVNTYATIKDGVVNLAIVNKSPFSRKLKIYIKEKDGVAKKIITFTNAAWSTAILKFVSKPNILSHNVFEINEYGAREMGIPLDVGIIR